MESFQYIIEKKNLTHGRELKTENMYGGLKNVLCFAGGYFLLNEKLLPVRV